MSESTFQVQMRIERIYLKDLSFESPASPGVFAASVRPKMQIEISTRANPVSGDLHEVILSITVTARGEDDATLYIAEVQQAGVFAIEGIEGERLRQVLGVVCPNQLFPYLRESLDAVVVKGGFGPLHLAPVNFEAVFAQANKAAAEAAQAPETHH